jgi:hypothetical protein
MKTGLFKDSFLEDPWKHLISGKMQKPSIGEQPATIEPPVCSDEEGEIILSDEEDFNELRESETAGLGEGIVEAARQIS